VSMSVRGWALLVALLVPVAPRVAAAAAAEQRLTLDEAIGLALRKSEGIVIEREALGAAAAAARAARGAYDPLLELEGAADRSQPPVNSSFSGAPAGQLAPETKSLGADASIRQLLPTGGALTLRGSGARATSEGVFTPLSPAYSTEAGVELRQPLLRDRAIDGARLELRVTKAGHRGAAASLRRTLNETIAAAERAYWALAAARLGVSVREEAVSLAEEQLELTRSRVQSGSAPRTELAEPQAEIERRRGELLAATETVARAENALKLLILGDGDERSWLASIVPADSVAAEAAPVEVAESVERGLSARAELELGQAVVDRRRAEAAFASDGVWPRLDAVLSYDRFGLAGARNAAGPAAVPAGLDGNWATSFQSLGRGDFDAARVGVVLGLPILNRAARGNAEAARHLERQAEADLARVRNTIRAEVLDAAAALQTAGQRIEAARAGREAAEVQLSAERDRYGSGLSTNFLVLTRQNDLSRARLDEISALTDYRTAVTEMARATGSLIEERGIHLGGSSQ